MSLSSSTLSADMKSAIEAIPGIQITSSAELQAFTDALAGAIVAHITGHAVVNPGTFSNSGGPVAGQGTVS